MCRMRWWALTALFLGGCATGPLQENPLAIQAGPAPFTENPVYIPQGPMAYRMVFKKCLDVLDDYFEIAYANLYDGRIETHPGIAPGIEQPWKPGSPDLHQRLFAFCQTVRHRAVVLIRTAGDGGYFVDVKVLKELEDLSNPIQARAGAAVFRLDSPVERQFEVIEPADYQLGWIPQGRDFQLEQVLLHRLAEFNLAQEAPPEGHP